MKKVYSLLLAGMVGINSGALFAGDLSSTQSSCAKVKSCCSKNIKGIVASTKALLSKGACNVVSGSETVAHAAGISLYPILKAVKHYTKAAAWLAKNNSVVTNRSNEHVITTAAGVVTIATLLAVIVYQINQALADQEDEDEINIDEEELEELLASYQD